MLYMNQSNRIQSGILIDEISKSSGDCINFVLRNSRDEIFEEEYIEVDYLDEYWNPQNIGKLWASLNILMKSNDCITFDRIKEAVKKWAEKC